MFCIYFVCDWKVCKVFIWAAYGYKHNIYQDVADDIYHWDVLFTMVAMVTIMLLLWTHVRILVYQFMLTINLINLSVSSLITKFFKTINLYCHSVLTFFLQLTYLYQGKHGECKHFESQKCFLFNTHKANIINIGLQAELY